MADLLPEIITVGIAKTGRLYWFGGLFKTPEMHCTKDLITVERKYALLDSSLQKAAPDMLEALEEVRKDLIFEYGGGERGESEYAARYPKIEAAIKKAKGES